MAYLGNEPDLGVFQKLDNIGGSFNGVTTTFALTVGGVAVTPGTAQNLIISLNNVVQNPGVAYTISGTNIVFASAPAGGVTFWGVRLGDVFNVGAPSNGTVTPVMLSGGAPSWDVLGRVGIGTPTPAVRLDVVGTDALRVPVGTTAQRPTGATGYFRFNTSLTAFEGFNGSAWGPLGGGGGLTNFTDATNTSAPNATVPVNSLTASGAAAAIDVAIVTKGGGAFALAVADNTAAGGNKRGTNAIDLQTVRDAADQVASGSSAAAIGASNKAEASFSVAIGAGNSATGASFGGVAIGLLNTASNNSTAIGENNSVTGFDAAAIGESLFVSGSGAFAAGFNNTASGAYSSVPGGWQGTTNGIAGLLAYGFNGASLGRNQMSFFGGRLETTNSTATRITANAAGAAASNQLTLRNNSAFTIEGMVTARDTSTNDIKSWRFTGAVKRGANAAATSIVGTPTITTVAEDTNATTWTIGLAADTTNGSLAINATGQAGKTIRWTAVVHSVEVG